MTFLESYPDVFSPFVNSTFKYTGCIKIREFRILSVVGDHFSSPNMEIKKNRNSPRKDTLV
jgi:hypothetical protein